MTIDSMGAIFGAPMGMPALSSSVGWPIGEACLTALCYHGTLVQMSKDVQIVERVQTGVRMEKRLVKVLKALAEFHDMTLGDLLEGIVLHAFDGKCAFQAESLARIRDLKKFYGLNLDSRASHRLAEADKRRSLGKAK